MSSPYQCVHRVAAPTSVQIGALAASLPHIVAIKESFHGRRRGDAGGWGRAELGLGRARGRMLPTAWACRSLALAVGKRECECAAWGRDEGDLRRASVVADMTGSSSSCRHGGQVCHHAGAGAAKAEGHGTAARGSVDRRGGRAVTHCIAARGDPVVQVVGPTQVWRVGKADMVRKKLAFWQKRSPNCNFYGRYLFCHHAT
jgi:hypothetical protein